MAAAAPSPTASPPWSVGQHHLSTFIVSIIVIIIMVIYELYKSHTQTTTTACTLEYSVL